MNPNSTPARSRREFISALAAASATVALGGTATLRAAETARSTPPGATDTSPRSPALHVFSKPLTWLSYEETAALVAEAGYGGIDFSVRAGGHVLPERVRADLPKAVAAAQAAGLKAEMITTAITQASGPFARDILETAAQCGIKCYRLGWFSYDARAGTWGTLEKLKPGLRELAALNEKLGLHGGYQNHSGIHVGAPMWDIFELVRDLDPRWLGCQFDIRHATVEGAQSWPNTLQLLAPWVRSIDLKDFRWVQAPGKATVEDVPIGEGIVNFAQYFELVRKLQISAWRSVHFEYPPFERSPAVLPRAERRQVLLTAMRKDAAALQARLAAAKLN